MIPAARDMSERVETIGIGHTARATEFAESVSDRVLPVQFGPRARAVRSTTTGLIKNSGGALNGY